MDFNDFGFCAVDEDELEAVQQASAQLSETSETAHTLEEKLDKIYNAIQPLLNNLKANPEKSHIYWPNRLNKVEQFEDHLRKIYEG